MRRDRPAMDLYDALADGETHSRPFVRILPVQPLERIKDSVRELRVESHAVVLDDDAAYG